MRLQPVKRVVDALAGQHRVILHLGCGHNISFSARELAADSFLLRRLKEVPTVWGCTFCADPTPEQVREEKSATQLWREAGEP